MDEATAKDNVQALLTKIHQQPGWYAAIDVGHDTHWFGRALSAVALLVGAEEPQYVTGLFEVNAGQGVLHAFYPTSVVTIELTHGHETEPELSVTARPRAGLRSLAVATNVALGSGKQWEQGAWPGKVRVVAVYENGHQFTLPESQQNYDRLAPGLVEFLPSLKADLEVS